MSVLEKEIIAQYPGFAWYFLDKRAEITAALIVRKEPPLLYPDKHNIYVEQYLLFISTSKSIPQMPYYNLYIPLPKREMPVLPWLVIIKGVENLNIMNGDLFESSFYINIEGEIQ